MYPLAIVATALALGKAALAYNESLPIEQLFLDISVQDVINNSSGLPTLDPWATAYIAAIREGRYGDAVWARYHISGEVLANGTISGTNLTVLESMLEDGDEYSAGYPDLYAEAVKFYNTSSGDTHTEVLELIASLNGSDPAEIERRNIERRNKTWGIKCSGNHKANALDCAQLLYYMSEDHLYVGNFRAVASTRLIRSGP